jgi:lia operon protein LiaF
MERFRSGQFFAASLLILLGVLLLLGNLGLFAFSWSMCWALLLILFGGWLVWRGLTPHKEGWFPEWGWGLGDYEPDLAGKTLRNETFSHGLGDLDLDLRDAVFGDGENVVRASHGLGDVKIKVPREIALKVTARAGLGDVAVFDEKADGFAPVVEFQSDDYATAARKLFVEASVGLGEVKVVR